MNIAFEINLRCRFKIVKNLNFKNKVQIQSLLSVGLKEP